MEDVKQFNVLLAFGLDGVNHEPGEVVELTAEQAAGLPAGTVAAVEETANADVEAAPKAGDTCTLEDDTEGVLEEGEDGALVCVPKA